MDRLTGDEIERVARAATAIAPQMFWIIGGEPSVRRDRLQVVLRIPSWQTCGTSP